MWTQARDKLVDITLRVGGLQKACGLAIDPQEYLRSTVKIGMMQVVYEWALGTVRGILLYADQSFRFDCGLRLRVAFTSIRICDHL